MLTAQLKKLVSAAEKEPEPPAAAGPNRKLLAHVKDLMFNEIPQNPGAARYRHGGSALGGHREWFRGKTGNGRYRLFYRFDSTARIIIFAWLNDSGTLRTYGSSTNAYQVFGKMLAAGNPPADWDALLVAAAAEAKNSPSVFRP
ncbi:MAG: toxin [Gemmatimonas sp.]|nr:toxin [Gemmatimonas sp.]